MEKRLYCEMVENLNQILEECDLALKKIVLFGHCNATFELIDLLESKGLQVEAILDNNDAKQGLSYKGAHVIHPIRLMEIMQDFENDYIVLITSRFYASMLRQLREIGYMGPVRKLIDYNTYAEYSLSGDTISRMKEREQRGEELLSGLESKYPNYFKVFCPFNALGDIYFMSSYWSAFAKSRNIGQVVFCVVSDVLRDVIHLFRDVPVEVYEQKHLDAMIQAVIYIRDNHSFIAHHDRPYVINLSKALYVKKISLEQMYCCGVYGLPKDTVPEVPNKNQKKYHDINCIPKGKSVIFSPYAKSVIAISPNIWREAVQYYSEAGYRCFTNVVEDEVPLEGTEPISPSIFELKSVVERAGLFIGIRSGLCDVIREAKAKKIALYPDYNYCDTQWKAIEIYWIHQFDYNLLAEEGIPWERL